MPFFWMSEMSLACVGHLVRDFMNLSECLMPLFHLPCSGRSRWGRHGTGCMRVLSASTDRDVAEVRDGQHELREAMVLVRLVLSRVASARMSAHAQPRAHLAASSFDIRYGPGTGRYRIDRVLNGAGTN